MISRAGGSLYGEQRFTQAHREREKDRQSERESCEREHDR